VKQKEHPDSTVGETKGMSNSAHAYFTNSTVGEKKRAKAKQICAA